MIKYLWKKIYTVGVSELDDQHKEIIKILNQLSGAINQGSNQLKNLLDKLIEYTNYHFASEEKHFVRYDYPFITNHLKEHQDLRERILNLKANFEIYKQISINELSEITKDLQIKHMMLSGKKFGIYLTRRTNAAVSLT